MDPVGTLNKNEREIKERFSVARIGIFGSFARGEERPDSDVDIYVEFSNPTYDNYIELVFYLENLFGRSVELVTTNGVSPYLVPIINKEVVWCG